MVKWGAGLFLMLASMAGEAAVSPLAAQGVPAQLAEIRATLASINSKLDNIDPTLTTDIFTGPLQRASTALSNFKCMVVNTGTIDASFTIEVRSQDGSVQGSSACVDIAPGAVCSEEAGPTPDQVAYCYVSGISASSARVTLCAREGAVCVGFVTAP